MISNTCPRYSGRIGNTALKRISEQAEVIVRLDYETETAHVCVSAWPAMASRMERLYGVGKDRDADNCSRRWELPLKAISFRKPALPTADAKPKRLITPQRIAAMQAGRLAKSKTPA
jgi:hypothetical protein